MGNPLPLERRSGAHPRCPCRAHARAILRPQGSRAGREALVGGALADLRYPRAAAGVSAGLRTPRRRSRSSPSANRSKRASCDCSKRRTPSGADKSPKCLPASARRIWRRVVRSCCSVVPACSPRSCSTPSTRNCVTPDEARASSDASSSPVTIPSRNRMSIGRIRDIYSGRCFPSLVFSDSDGPQDDPLREYRDYAILRIVRGTLSQFRLRLWVGFIGDARGGSDVDRCRAQPDARRGRCRRLPAQTPIRRAAAAGRAALHAAPPVEERVLPKQHPHRGAPGAARPHHRIGLPGMAAVRRALLLARRRHGPVVRTPKGRSRFFQLGADRTPRGQAARPWWAARKWPG